MKVFAVLASLAIAVRATHAIECSLETMASLNGESENEKFDAACKASLTSLYTSTDVVAAAKKLCADTTCMNAMEDLIKAFPDCTVQGVVFKKPLEDQFKIAQSECKKITGASSAATLAASVSATAVLVATMALFAQD